jgi:pyridoxine 5-phosphate synthase
MIEIHTGQYALKRHEKDIINELEKIRIVAQMAKELGLGVNAGHGLNYINIVPIANITDIDEVSIGHCIISRAVFTGLHKAVADMISIIRRVRT